MTTPKPAGQPSLHELTTRFLAAKAAHPTAEADDLGDVVPHEVAGGFRAPAKLTWDEALVAFRLCGVEPEKLASPPEWAAFAALETTTVGVPLAAGLFPQRVRQVPRLLSADGLSRLAAPCEPQPGFPGLRGWIRKALRSKSATTLLIAAGVAAALGDAANADAALTAAEEQCVGPWRTVWENQRGAVLWLTGRRDEAAKAWAAAENPTAAFNSGLASLPTGSASEVAAAFRTAASKLPENSGWSHLAKLYAALAQPAHR